MATSIILASSSPRRRELLRQIGVSFESVVVDVNESPIPEEQACAYVERVALAKAREGMLQMQNNSLVLPVLAADTAVVIDEQILGKPRDLQDARRMLQSLSGRSHKVYSAVALLGIKEAVRLSISRVTFRELQLREIDAYWETDEPRDKAGAYAIQGKAAAFITKLDGSYSGVMGLPLFETAELLRNTGIEVF